MGIAVGHSWNELCLLRGLRTCVHVWHIKKHKLCFTMDNRPRALLSLVLQMIHSEHMYLYVVYKNV